MLLADKTATPSDQCFSITAQDDSMNAAQIYEGSVVTIQKQTTVAADQIAAIVVDSGCLMIRRLAYGGGTVTLVPASTNPEYQPQTLPVNCVRILGRVVRAVIDICPASMPMEAR